MIEPRRILERRHCPIQEAHPLMQCWIARPNVFYVELEVLQIDWVEPDERSEETDVSCRDAPAEEVRSCARGLADRFFCSAQGREHLDGRALVSFLGPASKLLVRLLRWSKLITHCAKPAR